MCPLHLAIMRKYACRERHAYRLCRLPIKPVSTCPTAPLSRNGIQEWLTAARIIRLEPSHGSTATTLLPRLKRETLGYQPICEWSEKSASGQKRTFNPPSQRCMVLI